MALDSTQRNKQKGASQVQMEPLSRSSTGSSLVPVKDDEFEEDWRSVMTDDVGHLVVSGNSSRRSTDTRLAMDFAVRRIIEAAERYQVPSNFEHQTDIVAGTTFFAADWKACGQSAVELGDGAVVMRGPYSDKLFLTSGRMIRDYEMIRVDDLSNRIACAHVFGMMICRDMVVYSAALFNDTARALVCYKGLDAVLGNRWELDMHYTRHGDTGVYLLEFARLRNCGCARM